MDRNPGASLDVAIGAGAAGIAEPDRAEGTTRTEVIRLLVDGPTTAADIADRLGISAAGVRRHLDVLLEEGAVAVRECRSRLPRGRGRPAREYLLTDTGRSRLPHAYDELAAEALEFVDQVGGDAAVMTFARRRAVKLIEPFRAELAAADAVPQRIDVLARALSHAGYSASVDTVVAGHQLCQHHCPVAQVAVKFPQLCQAELEVFAEASGTYVQRLATIARGDSFCTTFVPGPVGSSGGPGTDIHRKGTVDLGITDVSGSRQAVNSKGRKTL
jgi:predicted ArsR family transcriptional regulator